jgi:heptosyltransferase-2
MNILIIKFGARGDVIRTAYILPGIYKKYTAPRICWYTSEDSFALLRFNPYIGEILTPSHARDLSQTEFDLIISLDDENEALSLLEGMCCKEFIGVYLLKGQPVYDDKAAAWFDMGLISRYGKASAVMLKEKVIMTDSKTRADKNSNRFKNIRCALL